MATPRYKLKVTLHHHTDTITALQFSPCGRYLASGSDDGVVFIFSTESWNPVKRFIDVSPVTSLLWHPSFPKTIICGFNSGDIHTACFEGSDMVDLGSLRKVWSDPMNGAVHCMVFNQEGTMMGIGHGAELSIVRAKTISTWSTVQQVPEPPFLPGLDENEALAPSLARSLHFINDGKMLIAAYLDHGIVCWNLSSLEVVWHLVPRTCCIGRSAISLDEKTLVVSNLYDGLDWYNIPDHVFTRAVPIRIVRNKPIPVLFIDNGNAIIVGSSSGAVRILDSRTAETIQTLDHDDDLIQAMDFRLNPEKGSRFIATGVSESGHDTKVRIWEAVAEDTSKTPDPDKTSETTDEDSSHFKKCLRGMAIFLFMYLLSLYLAVREDAVRTGLDAMSHWIAHIVWPVARTAEARGFSTERTIPSPTATESIEPLVTVTLP